MDGEDGDESGNLTRAGLVCEAWSERYGSSAQ